MREQRNPDKLGMSPADVVLWQIAGVLVGGFSAMAALAWGLAGCGELLCLPLVGGLVGTLWGARPRRK